MTIDRTDEAEFRGNVRLDGKTGQEGDLVQGDEVLRVTHRQVEPPPFDGNRHDAVFRGQAGGDGGQHFRRDVFEAQGRRVARAGLLGEVCAESVLIDQPELDEAVAEALAKEGLVVQRPLQLLLRDLTLAAEPVAELLSQGRSPPAPGQVRVYVRRGGRRLRQGTAGTLAMPRAVPPTVAAGAPAAERTTRGGRATPVARGDLLRRGLAGLDALLAQHRLTAQPDAVAVHLDHLHQDLFALANLILDLLDAVLGDLGDVQESLDAGQDFDERAEVRDARHFSEIRLAGLGLGGDLLDDLDRLHGRGLVHRGDMNAAVVLDVDLATRSLDDRADHLAARADHLPDLVLVDADGKNARRERRDIRPRLRQRRVHHVQDLHPGLARLAEGLLHDRLADAIDLDVHLQGGDPVARSRHLEIHVAVMVFHTGDVGQDDVVVALLDEPHGRSGHRGAQRHTGVHQREGTTADRRHGG